MAVCKNMLHAELDLSKPVPETCSVIAHVLTAWPGKEKEILTALRGEIDSHLFRLKGAEEDAKPLRESDAEQKDK